MDNVIDRNYLRQEYEQFLPALTLTVKELEKRIEKLSLAYASNVRVKGRVKSFESYYKKHLRLLKKGHDGPGITDLVGIRIICLFVEDLAAVEKLLAKEFRIVEVERKGDAHNFREFGYASIHLLVELPEDLTTKLEGSLCKTAEIQIRTILQDAWAEVEHELIYKA
jgi:putative GTP pyrophosphokinase